MVARVTRNPILKGLRVRNQLMAKRVNKTGRRRCVQAPPEERLERHCPHLQFIEPERYDRVLRQVNARHANCSRKGVNGVDPRKNVPKKHTAWPGQHLRCGICGRILHWVGSQGRPQMTCSGAVNYQCWNSVVVSGDTVVRKLTEAIMAEVQALPDFDVTFMEKVRLEVVEARAKQSVRQLELRRRLEDIARQIDKITDAICRLSDSQALLEKLQQLERQKSEVEQEVDELNEAPAAEVSVPSIAEIKHRSAEIFQSFACRDREAQRLLRRLIPDLRVYPYQLCDGGAVELRARFTMNLAVLSSATTLANDLEGVLRREVTVDLFDPPQRVAYRQQVVTRRAAGLTERQVAKELGITHTAAQRAAALDRMMNLRGLTDPYIPLLEPSANFGKMRRHKHPRYKFEPLDGGTI